MCFVLVRELVSGRFTFISKTEKDYTAPDARGALRTAQSVLCISYGMYKMINVPCALSLVYTALSRVCVGV